MDSNGTVYNAIGGVSGRIDDNGNMYDASGAYVGHIDGSCDDACKQAAAAKLR